jgi:PIN domain nuclease of toxin-antitoxin system
VLAPVDHDDPIHDHRLDTNRVLVRLVEAGAVGDGIGVEQDQIRGLSLGDRATVREAKRRKLLLTGARERVELSR